VVRRRLFPLASWPTNADRLRSWPPHPPGMPRPRAANQPISTRFELAHRLRDVKRRFLTYTFPSRLPDPARLVVPGRPVVVRTAPALTGASRLRLSSASPASCGWPGAGPFTPPGVTVIYGYLPLQTSSASWRTHSSLQKRRDLPRSPARSGLPHPARPHNPSPAGTLPSSGITGVVAVTG